MDGAQVVVVEVEVAAGDLQRARRMAEDALQAEHVAAVAQEAAREGVAQDVRRAAHRQGLPARQAAEDLLDAVGGQAAAVGREEERITRLDLAAREA